jgi:predicted Rossmann-fold nucleotide-binding protein
MSALRAGPTLAVFASDRGPGDPERATLMSQAGSLLARRGTRLVCLAEEDGLPVPLMTAARASGGDILVVADESFALPRALAEVPIERYPGPEARLFRVATLADVFVGLPGSLMSVQHLYQAWAKAGGGAGGKPVVLLNRNRAFEAVRGLYADVFSHSVKHADRYVQFADSVDDLWNKVNWLLNEVRAAR